MQFLSVPLLSQARRKTLSDCLFPGVPEDVTHGHILPFLDNSSEERFLRAVLEWECARSQARRKTLSSNCLFPGVPKDVTHGHILPFLDNSSLPCTLRQLFQTCVSVGQAFDGNDAEQAFVARFFFCRRMSNIEKRFRCAALEWECVRDEAAGPGATTVLKCGPVRDADAPGVPFHWTDMMELLPDADALQKKIGCLYPLVEPITDHVYDSFIEDLIEKLRDLQDLRKVGVVLLREEAVRCRALARREKSSTVVGGSERVPRAVRRLLLPGRMKSPGKSQGQQESCCLSFWSWSTLERAITTICGSISM